jgi:acyl carrier protein
MHPAVLELLQELPVTYAGKIDKKYLRDMLQHSDNFARKEEVCQMPRTPLEGVLCDIFQAVLKLEYVDVHSDFFDLGGHSLNATQVVLLVRRHLGIEMKIKDLFMHSSVARLAEVLQSRGLVDSSDEPGLVFDELSAADSEISAEPVFEEIEI